MCAAFSLKRRGNDMRTMKTNYEFILPDPVKDLSVVKYRLRGGISGSDFRRTALLNNKSIYHRFSPLQTRVAENLKFTLIELVVAMGVFALLMLVLLSLFSSAQKAWTRLNQESEVFENAQIAMDLIGRELQCTYYEVNKTPFWFKPATTWGGADTAPYTNLCVASSAVAKNANTKYDNQALCFISSTLLPPNKECNSKLCEVKYQLYKAVLGPSFQSDTSAGWLQRSATGDVKSTGGNNLYNATSNTTGKYKFYNIYNVCGSGSSGSLNTTVFTLDNYSSEDWVKVIPYVTSLIFECYKRNGDPINGYANASATTSAAPTALSTPLPYSIKITFTLLDKESWDKWKALVGTSTTEPAAAKTYRERRERKFSKTVVIGERGQL